MSDIPVDDPREPDCSVPICAIGASAGGLKALRELFQRLPDDLGLAYVIIVHLSPEHPSALADILKNCTSMPVFQVTDSPSICANSVYVIPPDRELVIERDTVTARAFTERRGHRTPVDLFFRSVAATCGDGIAVVLSGSGADGSNGVRSVHEAGGVILVQDPTEAEFSAMPQNTIATGVVNFVGPVAKLAQRITEVARSKDAVRSLDQDAFSNDLRRIIALIKARTGHDFSSYKRATVTRRVLRRMQVCRTSSISEYVDYVQTSPEEAKELFQDLLISVTQFFRDETAFETLRSRVLAPLFKRPDDEGIRIWTAGCATGEEAYSLAILLLEEAERCRVRLPVQIFASDLDEGALATAREGRYPRSIEADVSDERLRRFFVDEGSHYRVAEVVRDTVLFASHSVLKDPPFMRLDLITCRNLLIYLERPLQEQLLAILHYGLRPGGHLFLGSAETADTSTQLFAPTDREARLYSARPQPHRHLPVLPHATVHRLDPTSGPAGREDPGRPASPSKLHGATLEAMAPPSVLVDDAHQILHLSSTAGRFILHSGGIFSGRLTSVVHEPLRIDLKIALDIAFQRGLPSMSHPTPVAFGEEMRRVAMHVLPMRDESDKDVLRALVVFLDGGPVTRDEPSDEIDTETAPQEVRRLRGELVSAKEALFTSRTEHDTAIEDLRAANEELQSMHEEYRSTAEELETSKEELQSMNEELQTVNSELKTKLESISSAHSDLRNLTAATEIGTLFLDSRLRIRMFTPATAELFNITAMDTGRQITDFTHRLNYGQVEEDARRVLEDLALVENEVQSRDGRWFMLRIRPYRRVDDEQIDGVVLTFVDITARRRTEDLLLESREQYQTLFNSIDEGFFIMEIVHDDDGNAVDFKYVEVNAAFERQTGLHNVVGKTAREMVPDLEEFWIDVYATVARTREPERFEYPADSLNRYYEVFAFPLAKKGKAPRVGALFRDVRDRKEAEMQRELLTHELSHRVKNTLAVVQALARQPDSSAQSIEQYRIGLIGRIRALAQAHDQLLQTNWRSADLDALVRATVSVYRPTEEPEVSVNGPPVELTPKQGLGLALILHELATNASKYGSLSNQSGTLRIDWEIIEGAEGEEIALTWQESGGPTVSPPEQKGFGTKLIERASSYELDGSAELFYERDGLIVKIAFPRH